MDVILGSVLMQNVFFLAIRYTADNINVEHLQYEYKYKIIKPNDLCMAAMYYR